MSTRKLKRPPETKEQRRTRLAQAHKGAKSGRYMLIRFLAAVLFFMNLYWAFLIAAMNPSLAVAVPVLNVLIAAGTLAEAAVCVSHIEDEKEYLAISHKTLIASCALTLVAIGMTMATGPAVFFPFFATPVAGVVIALIALTIKIVLITRIIAVRDRTDKRYQTYLHYLEVAKATKGR